MIRVISIILTIFTVISIISTYKGTRLQGIYAKRETVSVRSTSTYSSSSSSSSGWSSGK